MKKSTFSFDPGTGFSASEKQSRIMNKDGKFNIIHINRKISFNDVYGYLLDTSWVKFFCLIFLFFILFNLLFGFVYYEIGVESLGIQSESIISDFLNSFYFSTQTFTTIGYGYLAPKTLLVSAISAFEGFVGLIFFALTSGLFYGRFSRPNPNLLFSDFCVIKPHNQGKALMFKLIHKNKPIAMNLTLEVVMALKTNKENKNLYSYFPIKLERNRITMMPYTWTVVHQIDDSSPLTLNKYMESIEQNQLNAEFLIMANYYDETFLQQIYQRHSYTFDEIKIDKVFKQNFQYNVDGIGLLDHQGLNELEEITDL